MSYLGFKNGKSCMFCTFDMSANGGNGPSSMIQFDDAGVENCVVTLKTRFVSPIGLPSHPLGLGRKIPILAVQLSDGTEPSIDLGLPMMRATIPIEKLGRIGYLAFPSFPAAEALCTRRPPEDRGQPAGDWAYEVPLMTTEMSGAWNENDPLVEAAKLNAKPALMRAAYVGTNHAGGNFAPIRVRPSDYLNTDVSAASNKSLSSEPIEIQRQAVLQTSALAWACHPRLQVWLSK